MQHNYQVLSVLDSKLPDFVRNMEQAETASFKLEDHVKKIESALHVKYDWEEGVYSLKSYPNIALIPVIGSLAKFSWGWSYTAISDMVTKAKKSDKYKAIILYMDTPGGEVNGVADLAAELMAVRNKKLVTYISGLGASAGMWIAASTQRIYAEANNDNVIGSIGVQVIHADYSENLKNEGIKIELIRSAGAEKKNAANPYEPLSKEARAALQDRVNAIASNFKNHLSTRLGISLDSEAFNGDIFNTAKAQSLGLIHETSTLNDLAAQLLGASLSGESTGSTSAQVTNSNQNNTSMKFKAVWASLLAAIGFASVTSEEEAPLVTEERLEQLNAALTAANENLTAEQKRANDLQLQLTAAQGQVSALTSDRDAWKVKAETFGQRAGAPTGNPPTGKESEGESGEDPNASIIDNLPHNKAVDANFLFTKTSSN
jgi:ClpP class serine protease